MLTLKNDPIPFRKFDIVKLNGYENIYRIRIGDLRIARDDSNLKFIDLLV
jgi:mRNA-degrading endonuclease RelE of RelBE toxin-antitoxin system